jgi:uncharacterized membrane protein
MSVYAAAVFLHVLAASVWLGGHVLFAVAAPALRRQGPEGLRALRTLGLRFRVLSWLSVAALVATGLFFLASGWSASQPPLRDKLGLVGVAIVLKAAHDFWAAPRASSRRGAYVTGAVVLARGTLLVLLAVVYLATQLRR